MSRVRETEQQKAGHQLPQSGGAGKVANKGNGKNKRKKTKSGKY